MFFYLLSFSGFVTRPFMLRLLMNIASENFLCLRVFSTYKTTVVLNFDNRFLIKKHNLVSLIVLATCMASVLPSWNGLCSTHVFPDTA